MPTRRTISTDPQAGAVVDWAEITLTHRCNQRCFFCYEQGRGDEKEPDLNEVRRLLRQAREQAQLVVLCGREVLLRRDILEIIDFAVSLGLDVSVFTNGQALARAGLIEQLAEAGCTSVVVSFHFPDAETFGRGTRVSPKGFHRAIAGLNRVREYNLGHSSRPFFATTETDMFILNAGRLQEMRQTLLDALGDSPWSMRIGTLMSTEVHDIGLDHALEPFAGRRVELQAFIRSHPPHLPLSFVKTPLCLLPPGEEHRCVEVGYVYEGTTLTLNHEELDKITVDTDSTSVFRDIGRTMRDHPYRWVCRTCNLAPLCRFERFDWFNRNFQPRREHKPVPRQSTTVAEILSRMGPDRTAVTAMERVSRTLREEFRFPEEDLLDALSSTGPGEPGMVDAWIDREPLLVVEFRHDGHTVPLHLRAPRKNDGSEPLQNVIGYLDVRPRHSETVPRKIVRACLSAVARSRLPDIEQWADDHFFDMAAARLLRSAWHHFHERIWPGSDCFGSWRNESVRLTEPNLLVVELAHPTPARVELTYQIMEAVGDAVQSPQVSIAVSVVPHGDGERLPIDEYRALLLSVGGLLADAPALPSTLPYDRICNGGLDARFFDGAWRLLEGRSGDPESTRDELQFVVRDLTGGNAVYRFHVVQYGPHVPCFRRVGDLALWHSHPEVTPPSAAYTRVLMAAMERSKSSPPSEDNLREWRAAVAELLHRAGLAGQFEWTVRLKRRSE